MTEPRIFQWPKGRKYPPARKRTDFIVVHCSATPEGKDFDATDIDRWHTEKGWLGIGYHYVVHRDGSIETGRPDHLIGSHAVPYNEESIGVVYIGGLAKDGKTAKDTRTADQKDALKDLLRHLKARYRLAQIIGHRDILNVHKACPSFDAKAEYATI